MTAIARKDLTILDHPATAAAVDAIEKVIGGRQPLVAALLHAPQTDGLDYVINLIADPRSDARALSTLCRAGNITPGELLEAYKRGKYAQMQIQVVHTIAEKTPAVVDDVLTRAAPYLVDCPACRGSLTVLNPSWDPKTPDAADQDVPCGCVKSSTPGVITVLPDVDRQKLALDVAHLLPQKGPAVVVDNRQQAFARFDASPQGFSALLGETDAALHRRSTTAPSVVEAEVVDPGEGASSVDEGFDPE